MRKYLFSLWLVVLLIFLSGCTYKVTTSNEIQFLTWGSSTEMGIMKPIVEEYNKNNEMKVRLMHVPQNYFQKLHLLFASNMAPDIIFINNLYLPIYQKAGLLEDMTSLINKEEYFKNAIDTLSIDGKIYAVPRDVSSMVIFYNKNLFKKSSIKINNNWSIEDFYSIAKKLKEKNEYGFCTEFDPGYLENFISIENKPLFVKNKLTINEEKSIYAMQKLADAINKESLSPNKEQLSLSPCAQLFIQEKSPMLLSGRWSVPKISNQAYFEYGILPFPKGSSVYYIPLNASGWAISKASKHKAEAINFVNYLSSDENIKKLTESGLITPAKKKVAYSKYFKNGDVFLDIIDKSTPNTVPDDYNIIIDKLKVASKSILGGYQSARQGLQKID